jgi:hypothetical protein
MFNIGDRVVVNSLQYYQSREENSLFLPIYGTNTAGIIQGHDFASNFFLVRYSDSTAYWYSPNVIKLQLSEKKKLNKYSFNAWK